MKLFKYLSALLPLLCLCASLSAQSEDAVPKLYLASLEAYKLSQYERSMALIDSCIVLSAEAGLRNLQMDALAFKKDLQTKLMDYRGAEQTSLLLNRMRAESASDPSVVMDMAQQAIDNGELESAALLADRYAQMLPQMSKREKFNYAELMYNLSHSRRDREAALNWALKCCDLSIEAYEDVSVRTRWLGNLAICQAEAGLVSEARGTSEKLLEYINSELLDPESKCSICLRVAILHKRLGELDKALECCDLAREFAPEFFNCNALAMKAGYLFQAGRYEDSRKCYLEYLEFCGRHYGSESGQYTQALCWLANIEAFCGMIDQGSEHYVEASRITREIVRRHWQYSSPTARNTLWEDVCSLFYDMEAFGVAAGHVCDYFTEEAYNSLILSKGLMLSTDRSLSAAMRFERDTVALALCNKALTLRNSLGDAPVQEIPNIYTQLNVTEAELARRSASYRDYVSFMDKGFREVRDALKPGEVVVDFSDFVAYSGENKYSAFVIKKEYGHPRLLPVFSSKSLDSLAVPASRPDLLYSSPHSEELWRIIWKPLQELVGDCSRVYLVPSGILHNIAVEALTCPSGRLLSDEVDIVRLTSARAIIDAKAPAVPQDAVLYGGIDYASGDALKASKREVESIGGLLSLNLKSVSVRSGQEGSLESFRSLDGDAPDLLHLAVHGWYSGPDTGSEAINLASPSAMRLSGMVLSDGNVHSGEIAGMDLSGTSLAVLALCRSGRGVVTREGVYGLQRAFKKAGVHSLLMTLWDVSDKASEDFMTAFYENLSSNGWHTGEAFLAARDSIRRKYRHPYYWAGFVMLDCVEKNSVGGGYFSSSAVLTVNQNSPLCNRQTTFTPSMNL